MVTVTTDTCEVIFLLKKTLSHAQLSSLFQQEGNVLRHSWVANLITIQLDRIKSHI
jgi:hypothetical protein